MPLTRRAALLSLLLTPSLLPAQAIQLGPDWGPAKSAPQRVEQTTDTATVPAGHPAAVEITFRIAPGLHINSHTPHDELLISTELKLSPAGRLKLLKLNYPSGTPFHLEEGAGEALDVYQGEFRVRLDVVSPRGNTALSGTLRYQACDNRACFPPRTLPVHLVVTGR